MRSFGKALLATAVLLSAISGVRAQATSDQTLPGFLWSSGCPAGQTICFAPFGPVSISRIPSSAASTNLTTAKSSGARLYKIVACNTTTTAARIKFYNSASPTVGTTAPLLTRPIPPAASAGGLACVSYDMSDVGWSFSTALSYALTQGAADSDTTAVTSGQITDVSVEYQ